MTALLISAKPEHPANRPDDVPWSGVLYGHMMPGLALIASRLAAQQRRPHQPPAETARAATGPLDRSAPADRR